METELVLLKKNVGTKHKMASRITLLSYNVWRNTIAGNRGNDREAYGDLVVSGDFLHNPSSPKNARI